MRVVKLFLQMKKVLTFVMVAFLLNTAMANKNVEFSPDVLNLFKTSELKEISKMPQLMLSYIKNAQQSYKMGDFTKSLVFLEKCQERDKSSKIISEKISFCKEMIGKQNELVLTYPLNDKEKLSLIKSKYKSAVKLFKDEKFSEAGNMLVEIWIVAGDYKKTINYLDQIAEKSKPVQINQDFSSKGSGENMKEQIILAQNTEEAAAQKEKIKGILENAQRYLDEGALDSAKSEAEKVFVLDPENSKAQKIISKVEKAKQKEAELKELESKKAKEQQLAQKISEAEQLLKEKNYDAAISSAQAIIKDNPENSAAQKIISKATAAKEKEAQSADKNKLAQEKEAAQAKIKEESEKLKAAEAKALEEKAGKEQIIAEKLAQANSLLKEKNYDGAITAADSVLKDDPENSKAQKIIDKANELKDKERIAKEKEAAKLKENEESQKLKEAARKEKELLAKEKEDAKRKAEEEKIKLKEASEKSKQEEIAKQEKINQKLDEANSLLKEKNYNAAIIAAQSVLKDDPENSKAQKIIDKINTVKAKEQELTEKEKIAKEKEEAELKAKEEAAKLKETEQKEKERLAKEKEEAELKAKEEAAKIKDAEQKQKEAQLAKEQELNTKIQEADSFLQDKNYDAAITAADNILKDYPENAKALKIKSKAEIAKDKEKTAKEKEEAKLKAKEEAAKLKEAEQREKERLAKEKEEAELKAKEEAAKIKEAEEKKKAELAAKEKEKAALVIAEPKTQDTTEDKELKKIQEEEQKKTEKAKKLTDDGIQLFDKKKYESALEKFNEALELQPLFAKAIEYKEKTTKEIEALKVVEAKPPAEPKKQESAPATPPSAPFITLPSEQPAPQETPKEPSPEQKAADENKQKIKALFDEAKSLYKAKKYDQAEIKIREILNIEPANQDAVALSETIAKDRKQEKIDGIIAEAKKFEDSKSYQAAVDKYNEVLFIDPQNKVALAAIDKNKKRIQEDQDISKQRELEKNKARADQLFTQGLNSYKQKNLDDAIKSWQEAITYYPDHKEAKTYLSETKAEYDKYLADKQKTLTEAEKENAIIDKMNTPVTISTRVPTRISKFLENLSIITGINYSIAEGVDANIEAKYEDKPLHDVLDAILLPIGLKWERKPKTDIVIVTPDLNTKIFSLNQEEMIKVKSLYDSQRLQKVLWGEEAMPKLKGVELTLDEREMVLISVDSKVNQEKLTAFLKDLKAEAAPAMITRSYNIKPDEAPKIKAYLEARLKVDSKAAYSKEQKLIIDDTGEVLFVKDTPENIKVVEDFLKDRNLLNQLDQGKLEISTFSLVPKNVLEMDKQAKNDFMIMVQNVIETFLYSKEGMQAAGEKGRKMWPDFDAMQITVTDYPENIRAVGQFIESLPQIERRKKSKIIFLKNATSGDMKSDLESILGISGAETGMAQRRGTAAAGTVQKSLSVNDEIEYQGLKIRLTKVNENDVNDKYDDSAEFVIRTPTTSQDATIEEFRSEFVEDYEITAVDIRPSGTTGQGRAKIEIRYTSGLGGGSGFGSGGELGLGGAPQPQPQQVQGQLGAQATPTPPETSLTIESIDNLNALLIRYENPAEFAEVFDWIQQFDIPTLQVSIETKFVEVIENKAKEFGSEFALTDLTEGVSFDNSIMAMRYANDYDELRSQFDVPVESVRAANLMKGTTVISLLTGGRNPLNYQLRLLEAEGIINVVNGPHILTKNRENATFQIERLFDPIGDQQTTTVGRSPIQYVDMDVEPTVTYLGSIDLDINVELLDYDQNLGQSVSVQRGNVTGIDIGAVQNVFEMLRIRKRLETKARIKDGGTIVIGGWTQERSGQYTSGIPVLRHVPLIGKLLFGRNMMNMDKTTLLIFLTGKIID